MSKTIVIGDCHFTNAYPSLNYLDTQIECIRKILKSELQYESPYTAGDHRVVFLGDLFHFRKPDPETIVVVKRFFESLSKTYPFVRFHILRGNHDTASKTDSGEFVTILDVLHSDNIEVVKDYAFSPIQYITNTLKLKTRAFLHFIPHYESDALILDKLKLVDDSKRELNLVFGHFGYAGCLNTNGDQDFLLNTDSFKHKTFLGHIHKPQDNGNVFVVGTPYSTSFGESDNNHRYAVIDNTTGEHRFVPITHGPRYLQFDYGSLEANKDFISDPNYKTILRVYLHHITDQNSVDLRKNIISEYNVDYVDIKYLPLLDDKSDISSFRPKSMMFELDDEFIDNYVNSNSSSIPKDRLLNGLNLLKGSE